MNEETIEHIQRSLEMRETEDLQAIWEANDHKTWSAEAFEAMGRILVERLGKVPVRGQTTWRNADGTNASGQDLGNFDIRDLKDLSTQSLLDLRQAIDGILRERQDPETIIEQANRFLDQAWVLNEKGDYSTAVQMCDEALVLEPDAAAIHNFRGELFRSLGDLNNAIAAFRTAARLDPDLDAASENLSRAMSEWRLNGQRDELAGAGPSLKSPPIPYNMTPESAQQQAAETLNDATRLFEMEENSAYEEALHLCDRALGLDPNNAEGHNLRGLICDALDDLEGAIASYQEAVRLEPGFEEAISNLRDALDDQHGGPGWVRYRSPL